ncbi:MAG: ABC transporter transmembrane domain-containing protein, partial [Anaerolineae bacterium]
MSISEFEVSRAWESNRSGPVRWILSHVRRHKVFVAGMLIGAAGNAALAAAMQLFIGRAVSAATASPADVRGLTAAAALVAGSQLIRGLILQLARNWSSEMLGQRLERDIREELYASLIGKSMSFHDAQPTGDLMARATNDVRQINLMFNPGINLVIGSANFLLMPLIVSPSIHAQLIATPILYLLAYVFAVRNYLRQLRPATERVREEFSAVNTTLVEAIDGIETVKGAAQED